MTATAGTAAGGRGGAARTGVAGAVDAIAALSAAPVGAGVLDAVRRTFNLRRYDLYRALHLYDTTRRGALNVPSFCAALVSAGLKLSRPQFDAVKAALVAAAAAAGAGGRGGVGGTSLHENDVQVAYPAFFDGVFAE
jgi:hypothetical protein